MLSNLPAAELDGKGGVVDVFDAENEFYRRCDPVRISKFLAHAKLYEMSLGLPGEFVEAGVFKGASFCRFRKLGKLFHADHVRRFIGFDVFGRFPDVDYEPDRDELERQLVSDGDTSIDIEELTRILEDQGLAGNVELIKGDVRETLPGYVDAHPETVFAIVNIALDLYQATKTALEILFPRVVRGGIVILDDYAAGFPGANKAIDEHLEENHCPERIRKFPFSQTPCYLIKE